jgi:dTDP-D-glucose 4,6-dehydratase
MISDRLAKLGWQPTKPFETSLRETVQWYRDTESWWRPIVESEDYQSFIKRFYGPGLGDDL